MKVVLFFPDCEVDTTLPLIPRKGERFCWQRRAEIGDSTWLVKDVEWVAGEEIEPWVSLVLVPAEQPDPRDEEVLRAMEEQLRSIDSREGSPDQG